MALGPWARRHREQRLWGLVEDRIERERIEDSCGVGLGRSMAKIEGRQKRMRLDRDADTPDDRCDVRGS